MKLPELDTICALATPPGVGAVAIIRISGKEAIEVADSIFKARNSNHTLKTMSSHSMRLGDIISEGKMLDEVLISVFKNPHSYTGEDVVEINSHGSMYVQKKILELLHQKGVRPAQEGEFTLRAYLNKKLDLSQAEAVADLISSESEADHAIAMQQMRGGFTSDLQALRTQLIEFSALIELELDFSEEDLEFANREKFQSLLGNIHEVLQDLIQSFSYGNVIKEGVAVAIVGKPNVGKSSLLNTLLKEEKAIVSDIAGTTRDSIEDTLILQGIKFRFIDTAGLRETEDTIEKIGVERAKGKVQKAKIALYVFAEEESTAEEVIENVQSIYQEGVHFILVKNKIDQQGGYLDSDYNRTISEALIPKYTDSLVAISANDPKSIKPLEQMLVDTVQSMPHSGTVVSNSRHFHALQQAQNHIQEVQNGLEIGISGDLLAQDIRQALHYLGEITGEVDIDQDILGTIFSRFCIGK